MSLAGAPQNGLVTLTFDLARRRCKSLYTIDIPSLKFIGLPVLKILPISGHGTALSGLLTSTFHLGTGQNVSRGMENLPDNFCFCDFLMSSYGQTCIGLTT